jgi:outer membrane protein assembly factor BamB
MNARRIFPGLAVMGFLSAAMAADWDRFRGPNGSGIAGDDKQPPLEWSEAKNLKWKADLPGGGYSCPIVVKGRVFVTAATDEGGNLTRHLLCFDRADGKLLWERTVAAKAAEDRSRSGYATHTPTADGERVYAFFGKSGVHAFDFDGQPLWQANVGEGEERRGWGSASSPILVNELVVITAGVESLAMHAFDRKTGKQAWKTEADGFHNTWGTPVVARTDDAAHIVLSVPDEIWGINPETGKLRWYSEGLRGDSVCNSAIVDQNMIYALGERGGGSLAMRAGGQGDVTQSNVVWTGANGPRIPTPVLWEGRLYWVSGSLANCRDAATGKEIYAERIPGASGAGSAPQGEAGNEGRGFGGGSGGGFGGGRGGGGGQGYSSPVAANGYLYQVVQRGETVVIKMGPSFELVARNRFANDNSDFSATPAISDGQLFIRSARHLYCVGE